MPDTSARPWWRRVFDPFWAVPLMCVAFATALGLGLPQVDEATWRWVPTLFHGGPSGARSLLGTIASSTISVTGLVFSITMVVLQLASSQFTPRVLGTFLESRTTQLTLGVFTGTFVYAMTVMRAVRDADDGGSAFVPQLAVSLSYVFMVLSVGFFLAFIHHITSSIRVSHVVVQIRHSTQATLDKMIPAEHEPYSTRSESPTWHAPAGHDAALTVPAPRGGILTDVAYRSLVDLGEKHDAVIELTRQVGEFTPEGVAIARVWRMDGAAVDRADLDVALPDDIAACLSIFDERAARQDVLFGFRQIVDIAERALSPGVNDPTTATQCLDALHALLRSAVQREVPNDCVTGSDGAVHLVYRPQRVEQMLDLAVDEVAHWGATSLQTPARLEAMLDDLLAVSLPMYRDQLYRLKQEAHAAEAAA